MKSRYIYMKVLGLLLVIVGFSYSLTSFNNFFSYIFETKIFPENLNIYLMSVGLIIPLSMFVYGVYFYFYTDFNITKISKLIFGYNLFLLVISAIIAIFNGMNLLAESSFFQLFEFIHYTFSYFAFFLSIMGLYGCFKYKF